VKRGETPRPGVSLSFFFQKSDAETAEHEGGERGGGKEGKKRTGIGDRLIKAGEKKQGGLTSERALFSFRTRNRRCKKKMEGGGRGETDTSSTASPRVSGEKLGQAFPRLFFH